MNLHKGIPDFSIPPGTVHVWLFRLDGPVWTDLAWEQSLSKEEVDRSKKFKFKMDRLRFIARRGILRLLLSRYSETPPAEIIYRTNPHGKLSLPSGHISFNLSSSQDRIAYAFVLEQDIGVDLEQVRPLPDLVRLAERWFSPEERAGLFALPADLQPGAFFHIWTQKEAFIKARGDGLSYPLKDFSVSAEPDKPAQLLSVKNVSEESRAWKMANGVFEEGWRVAVCVRMEAGPQVRWHGPDLFDFVARIHPPRGRA